MPDVSITVDDSGEVSADVAVAGLFTDTDAVDAIEKANGLTLSDNLDMAANRIINIATVDAEWDFARLRTSGSGSGRWNIKDSANNQDIFNALEGGNVEIPNGELTVGSSSVLNLTNDTSRIRFGNGDGTGSDVLRFQRGGDLSYMVLINENGNVEIPNGDLDVGELIIKPNWAEVRFGTDGGGSLARSSAFNIQQDNNNDRLAIGYQDGVSGDAFGTSDGILLDDAGNVEIPNGNLDLGENHILQVANIFSKTSANNLRLYTDGNGNSIILHDRTNNQTILKGREGGNVEVPNGDLTLSGATPSITGPSGSALHIDDGGNGYNDLRITTSGGAWAVYDTVGAKTITRFEQSGDVKILNGTVTVQGGISISDRNISADSSYNTNRIVTSGSSWTFRDSTNAQDIATFDEGGNVKIPNGHAEISDGVEHQQRASDPSTSELASGQVMTYVSDGSTGVTGAAGDLVYAINDAGTILTQVIAAKSNAT